jgi:hypothetical protein
VSNVRLSRTPLDPRTFADLHTCPCLCFVLACISVVLPSSKSNHRELCSVE